MRSTPRVDRPLEVHVQDPTLFRHALEGAAFYAEFGSGGSTAEACAPGRRVLSIESSRDWATRVRDQCPRAELVEWQWGSERWGYPAFSGGTADTIAYARAVRDRVDAGLIDVLLIDGRFRVACALHSWFSISPSCLVLFDDWDRTGYHVVKGFFDVVQEGRNHAVLRRRESSAPPDELISRYEQVQL